MLADRLLMEKINQLVNEENWNLDGALRGYSTVRHGMVTVLQPQPRTIASAAPMRTGRGQKDRERTPTPQSSKGKNDRKGKKEGEGKFKSEGKSSLMDDWDRSWFTHGSGACMRHNLTLCTSQ